MAKIAYLTVPDCVWLNFQLTGSPQEYRFDLLENCVMAQYSPGSAGDLVATARRIFATWQKEEPFVRGNASTGLAAAACFLRMNGLDLVLNSGNWDGVVRDWDGHQERAEMMAGVLADFADELKSISSGEMAVPLRAAARTRLTGELG